MAKNRKADLILHPIRIQILMALSGSQKTSQQLADELRDIPQATLYRHINRLAKAGIIDVVEERQVRGAVEKVYTLDELSGIVNAEDIANASKDDHIHYFIAFIATLLDDFSRYIHHSEQVDLLADGVGYNKFPLELSDDEMKELSAKMNAVLTPYFENKPGEGRRRHIFATIVMPDAGENNQ